MERVPISATRRIRTAAVGLALMFVGLLMMIAPHLAAAVFASEAEALVIDRVMAWFASILWSEPMGILLIGAGLLALLMARGRYEYRLPPRQVR